MTRVVRIRWALLAGAFVVGLLALCTTWARASDALLGASDAMFAYEPSLGGERADAVQVNGLEFEVVSGTTQDDLAVVLERFESLCSGENVDLRAELSALRGRSNRSSTAAPRGIFEGTLSAKGHGRGVVACLGRGGSARPFVARLRAFFATGDVAEIGAVHLFFATSERGGTAYVALASKGTLPVARAFPSRGDAPGRDPIGLPRPEQTERRLSAWAPDATASVFVYEASGAPPATVLSRYVGALRAAGFTLGPSSVGEDRVLAHAGNRAVVASVAASGAGSTLVTIATL